MRYTLTRLASSFLRTRVRVIRDMPPQSRFGASKFRNAVPHVPPKEEWYRSNLPTSSSSAPSTSTSTFTSEIKTCREGILTLTAGGDFSFREYGATPTTGEVKCCKGLGGGGGVGDWDVSRLESREETQVVVGGIDGSEREQINVYTLNREPNEPIKLVHTIPSSSGSPITHLSLNPSTPGILLVSTVSSPLTIHDISSPSSGSSEPIITLKCSEPEPKGLWCHAWSPDGRLVAAIGKSGTGYVFDPRSSTDVRVTRKNLPLQPLKPCRIAWVGDNVFVTSTSRMRNREYHLFSGSDLSTKFTQSLDTSPGLLIPQVDQERGIVYLAGKGDMSLRQVELSGPQGFQETLHPLPGPLVSGSWALAHPVTLPVMQAQIATVLVPATDKDGDALMPLGIKVPRRQLIDYHEDLYPDIMGIFPEQTATDWLRGEDKSPLRISLDPSRRGQWESKLQQSNPKPELPETKAKDVDPVGESSSATKSALGATLSSSATRPSPSPDLPPLEGDETYSSTSYKGRIIGHHIGQQLEIHRNQGKKGPLMVGLQGPQGCGKTTLCSALLSFLDEPPRSLKIAVLSLDDLYRTHGGLLELAKKHPDNALLQGRGPPGTHDVELAKSVLAQVQSINNVTDSTVELPIFDKSLCSGEGDRSTDTVKLQGPLDVFILEGWSMGFAPLKRADLEDRYAKKTSLSDTSYFATQPLSSLITLNDYLADFAEKVYPSFETVIQVEPESYEYVFDWRLEQERNMKAKNGGKGMEDAQVRGFVERYMPGYELWKDGIRSVDAPWAGRGLVLYYGSKREVIKVERPEGAAKATGAAAQMPEPTQTASKAESLVKNGSPQTARDPAKPLNPNWSRKFLAGKSPLIPTYDQVPPISTLHQDSQILRCTPRLACFPISGPGGRLAVHPLSKKGRMDTAEQTYLSAGVDIVDFAVEPSAGETTRVAIAGEDGTVRVWKVSGEGLTGDEAQPVTVLKNDGTDKVIQVCFHPTTKDLLTIVTSSSIRLYNLATGDLALTAPLGQAGAYNITWSSLGDRVAVAFKDHTLSILDPRKPESVVSGSAHDSPRSFQIVWIDSTHLLSVGFARGSTRRINLYEISPSEIKTTFSLLIDTSPSVLFPVYDPDTSILYLWGKGERQIQTFEVRLENEREPISKLPGFTAGSPQLGVGFLPKGEVDVKKVEVGKALRLTAKSIEEVSFSIPRNKPDFFQDDIFVDTLDVETASMSAEQWLKGSNTPQSLINLQPKGMTPLSQAPQTPAKARPRFVPARDIMSEEEKKKREMDNLFARAKLDDSSDEEPAPRTGLDPPDDDW